MVPDIFLDQTKYGNIRWQITNGGTDCMSDTRYNVIREPRRERARSIATAVTTFEGETQIHPHPAEGVDMIDGGYADRYSLSELLAFSTLPLAEKEEIIGIT